MVEHGREDFSKEVTLELTCDAGREQTVGEAREMGVPGKENGIKCEGSFQGKLIVKYECLHRSLYTDRNWRIRRGL